MLVPANTIPNPADAVTEEWSISAKQERQLVLRDFFRQRQAHVPCNVPVSIHISGDLRRQFVSDALQYLVDRYDVFRVCFQPSSNGAREEALERVAYGALPRRDGKGQAFTQRIAPEAAVECVFHDVSHLSAAERERQTGAVAEEAYLQEFDCGTMPLIRGVVISDADRDHDLLLVLSRLIIDARSIDIVVHDIATFVRSRIAGERIPATPPPLSYAVLAADEGARVTRGDFTESLAYWSEVWKEHWVDQLQPVDVPLAMPQCARPVTGTIGRETIHRPVSSAHAIRDAAALVGATFDGFCTAAFAVLLWRFTAKTQVAIWFKYSGRDRDSWQTPGWFSNLHLVPVEMSTSGPFDRLAIDSTQRLDAAAGHQHVPLELLWSIQGRTLESSFRPMLAVYHKRPEHYDLGDCSMRRRQARVRRRQNIDLQCEVRIVEHGLDVSVTYARKLFSQTSADRLLHAFADILESCAGDPTKKISRIC